MFLGGLRTHKSNHSNSLMAYDTTCEEISSGDRPRHQETTLGGVDAQTRFDIASKRSSDPPLSTGHTVRSVEDRMEQETNLTDFVPPTPMIHLSQEGSCLGTIQDCSRVDEQKVAKESQKIGNKAKERTPWMKLFKIGTSKKKTLDKEHVSKQGWNKSNRTEELNLFDKGSGETEVFDYTATVEKDVNVVEPVSTAGDVVNAASVIPNVSATGPSTSTSEDIFKDEMTTMADTLMAIRRTRPRTTLVVIHNVEEEPRRATPPLIAQIQRDAEITQRLFEEEQAQFEREKMIVREKAAEQEAKDAALIKQMKDRRKTSTRRKRTIHFNDSEQQAEGSKKRSRVDHNKESVKKQKLEEDDAKKEELRACLDIVPVEYITINVESLATKYPIVDWKTHTLTKHMIQDIMDLYRLVKERYETESPEGYDLLLWGDLITLFEPSEEDVIWKAQQDYNLISYRRTKGVVIRDPEESTTTTSIIIHSEAKSKDKEAELNRTIDWDKVIDHVKKKAKEDPAMKRYQALKRKPQSEAQARKNMMIYLKNVVGFKMDYFKGMSYDDIHPIFEAKFDSNVTFLQKTKEQIEEDESRALKRLNETPAEKAAKRQKLDDEVEELKIHLQIVPNEDDDVYTEATPLARTVPVVGYEIINQNNKPYYKIIRADDTHQLYIIFLTLLRNIDREDLEALWSLVKERFATAKPNNFSDEFLLITLGAMFEKPDIHHYIYNHTTDFVNREEVPTHKSVLKTALLCLTKRTMFHGRLVLSGDPNREVPVNETFHVQTDDELTEKELKQIEADDQAIQIILLGLPEDIYAVVDSCETAQKILLRVQQMMKGSDIGIQEKKAKLFNEWERFTSTDGESIKSYYHRFLKLMNDLKRNKHFPEKIAMLHQDQPSFNQNYMQQPIPNPEDITDPTNAINMALALMAKAFKLNYSTPTNNNQRISSNPRNRQIDQPGMNMGQDRQMQMVGGNGGNQFRQYARQSVGNLNGYNDAQNVENQVLQNANPNRNGNLAAAHAKGNANGHNDSVADCSKEEAGIQLQAKEFDLMAAAADLDEIEEVNANCILMANLQQASTSGTQTDKAPVYDSDGSTG
nr:hypothetical protein [Tanacetum cinerariifolium]